MHNQTNNIGGMTIHLSVVFSAIYYYFIIAYIPPAHCKAPTPDPNSFICHTDGQFSLGLLLP